MLYIYRLPPLPPTSRTAGIYYKFMICLISGPLGPFLSSLDRIVIEIAAESLLNRRI